MKKSSLYTILSLVIAIIIGSLGAININTAAEDKNADGPVSTLSSDAILPTPPNTISLKNESVYVITDQTGTADKTFIGNHLYDGTTPLPANLSIKYYLDDTEISPASLAHQSGHIKINYHFDAAKSTQGKFVPFLAVTGLQLNPTKFTNLKITNGKIINESKDNITIAGYAFVGLNQDLNTDFLPDNFTIEADAQDFELGTTYTFLSNELFADVDTSRLSSLDDVINSVNQLSQALDQIIAGSATLTDGLDSALAGAHDLTNGAAALNSGAHDLANGANTLHTSTETLATNMAKLSDGLDSVVAFDDKVLNQASDAVAEVNAMAESLITEYNLDRKTVAELTAPLLARYNQAQTAVYTYTDNIKALAAGANQLKEGTVALSDGTASLANGADTLAKGATSLYSGTQALENGLSQLSAGSHTLHSGLSTFKQTGIDQLVNFANQDLSSFIYNLRTTVSAANIYHSYSDPSAQSVKFIFKTPSIK